jgi:hypothetical protein
VHPPLVLDCRAVIDKSMLHWLHNHYGRKVLPTMAYIEAGIYYAAKGNARDQDEVNERLAAFNNLLNRAGVIVEPASFSFMATAVASALLVPQLPWGKNSHDHMIAAHAAIPPRVLVTLNTDDFKHLIPQDRLYNVYQVIDTWP